MPFVYRVPAAGKSRGLVPWVAKNRPVGFTQTLAKAQRLGTGDPQASVGLGYSHGFQPNPDSFVRCAVASLCVSNHHAADQFHATRVGFGYSYTIPALTLNSPDVA